MQRTVLFLSLGTYLYFLLASDLKVRWNFFALIEACTWSLLGAVVTSRGGVAQLEGHAKEPRALKLGSCRQTSVTSGDHPPSWELIFIILARWSFGWLCGPALVLSDSGWPGLHGECSRGEVGVGRRCGGEAMPWPSSSHLGSVAAPYP